MIFCNFPRGGPKTRKKPNFRTLVGFPFVSFHRISKKFRIWATFTYISTPSQQVHNPESSMTPHPAPPPPSVFSIFTGI